MNKKRKCIVISGASCAGKTTIINNFLRKYNTKITFVVYDITRNRRNNEVDGKDYNFITKTEFEERKKQHKYAFYYNLLETSRGVLKETLNVIHKNNNIPIIVIDYDHLDKIKVLYDVVDVFITTKNKQILIDRMIKRYGTFEKNDKLLQFRLKYNESFLETQKYYKYIIINDDIEKATDVLYMIYKKEFC